MPSDETNVFAALEERRSRGIPCVLVILVDSQGSVPAKKGAKMLVTENGRSFGTVGGGALEEAAKETARQVLTEGRPRLIHLDLNEAAGYACGGRASLYIEPVLPAPKLIVCGAGHVGRAVCHLGAYAGLTVTVVDDRKDMLDAESLPDAHDRLVCGFDDPFSGIDMDAETFVVVCTRAHAHDLEVVQTALATPAPYIGLLGSKRKRASFFKKLRQAGFSEENLKRIHTPVGLDIGAVTPREIAFSIVGELIEQRRKNVGCETGRHFAGCGSLPADGNDQAAVACAG